MIVGIRFRIEIRRRDEWCCSISISEVERSSVGDTHPFPLASTDASVSDVAMRQKA